MREIRTYGSEGGEEQSFPTPIVRCCHPGAGRDPESLGISKNWIPARRAACGTEWQLF
jgi:hypothetical protein